MLFHTSKGQDNNISLSSLDYTELQSELNNKNQSFQTELSNIQKRFFEKFSKQEKKLLKKLNKKDSLNIDIIITDIESEYNKLLQQYKKSPLSKTKLSYNSYLDSIQTSLSFLNKQNFIKSDIVLDLFPQFDNIQRELNAINGLDKLLQQRHNKLLDLLEAKGLGKHIKKLQQEIFVYKNQLTEIKNAWQHPALIENFAIELLNNIPEFKSFFGSQSLISNIFPPVSPDLTGFSVPGLQNRATLSSLLTDRLGSDRNIATAVSGSLSSSEDMLDRLKEKITNSLNGGGDIEMPDFKPDYQKGKSFWKRLELGTNLQSSKTSNYYPSAADIGVSLGYKLSDKSVIGIGTSYRLGLGTGIQNIAFTHEGIGLRSYVDVKLKGRFFISGGFEYNYRKPFENFRSLDHVRYWQQSGLVGMSKIVSLKSKTFKKTKLQLLWDFLSYNQQPITQPLVFRVGYSL